jgi:hypothetical protein
MVAQRRGAIVALALAGLPWPALAHGGAPMESGFFWFFVGGPAVLVALGLLIYFMVARHTGRQRYAIVNKMLVATVPALLVLCLMKLWVFAPLVWIVALYTCWRYARQHRGD